ncbi:MAG: DUF488 family protein [Acidimicrobiales bacterium]
MSGSWFTIGHSTRTVDEFIALLRKAAADTVIDVRSVPRSRADPQFNGDALPEALGAAVLGYRHIRRLGGLRAYRNGYVSFVQRVLEERQLPQLRRVRDDGRVPNRTGRARSRREVSLDAALPYRVMAHNNGWPITAC